jgi:hypothetical protein
LRAGSPLPLLAIARGAEGVVGGRGDGAALGTTSGTRFSDGCCCQKEIRQFLIFNF